MLNFHIDTEASIAYNHAVFIGWTLEIQSMISGRITCRIPFFLYSIISKNFGEGDVLRDISLDVARGEFVTLLGASGCRQNDNPGASFPVWKRLMKAASF